MLILDWKSISKCAGYCSLKAAYINDVQDASRMLQVNRFPMRNKKEFYKLFHWIIQRAIHTAIHTKQTIQFVLNNWEHDRNNSWWFGYYRNFKQPKFHSNVLKHLGIHGRLKHRRKSCNLQEIKKLRVQEIMIWQKQQSTKLPKRWSTKRKQLGY